MSDRFTQGHACVIGVGGDLPTTINDATELAKILKDPERCAYPEEQVHLLTGEGATKDRVIKALEDLAEATNDESTVIIYFSGHGHQLVSPAARSYYLMPHGYNTENLVDTAINGSDFTNLLRDIPAQKLLVLLDCCHAGGMAELPGFEVTKAPVPPEALKMFAKGGGRMMIASSKASELSYAGNPCSAFTYALITGLCGEARNRDDDPYIWATNLAMHTSSYVPGITNNKQHPVLEIPEKSTNFALAYYAAGRLQPKGLPIGLQQPPRIEARPGELNGQIVNTTTVVASGRGAVAIGGNANNNTIITGNNNILGNNNSVQNVTQRGKYNINLGSAQNFHIGDKFGDDDTDED
jgi:hypothetical protein